MAAVIGGIVIGNISGISIYLGDIGLKVLAVIILGGLDSIGGAILGGLIIGILEITPLKQFSWMMVNECRHQQ